VGKPAKLAPRGLAPRDGMAEQAVQVIEREAYAAAYLARLHAGMAQPGDLATLLSFLTGAAMYSLACGEAKFLPDSTPSKVPSRA
jgi:hypothetical protein